MASPHRWLQSARNSVITVRISLIALLFVLVQRYGQFFQIAHKAFPLLTPVLLPQYSADLNGMQTTQQTLDFNIEVWENMWKITSIVSHFILKCNNFYGLTSKFSFFFTSLATTTAWLDVVTPDAYRAAENVGRTKETHALRKTLAMVTVFLPV